MRFLKYLLTAATVVFGSDSAIAAEWRYLTSGTGGVVLFVDVESVREFPAVVIRRPFPIRQIWVKMDFSKDRTVAYREQKQLFRVNCEAETSMVASSATYAADGRVIRTWSADDYDFKYEPETPDTIGYAIMEFACGRRSLIPS